MPPEDYEKPNRLDALEQKLYSPRADIRAKPRKHLREKEYEVPQNWGDSQVRDLSDSGLSVDESRKNWFMRFFIVALIFFVGAAGYVGWKFFMDTGVDAQNVDISVNAPLTIGAGEDYAIDVLMQNQNAMNMQTVDIEVEFPDGTRSAKDISKDYKYVREEVGDIAVGQVAKKSYNALLFGEEGEKKEIVVRLSYRVDGYNMVFEKEKKFDVVLQSTPIRMTVTNVNELTSGQTLSFNVELISNSTHTLENVIVQATYPFGFQMLKSSLPAKDDKRTWIIPKLEPKEVVKFTVDGVLEGQNNEQRYFGFTAGLADESTSKPQVVFTSAGTTVGLARPFLELALSIDRDGSDVIVLDPEEVHGAQLSFKNNTGFSLRNVIMRLKIEGAVLNKDSMQVPEGFYQSANNTIQWDSTTAGDFADIPVGSSGIVTFNFTGLGINNSYLATNQELKLTATVEAIRSTENNVPETVENSITKTVRFNTQTAVNTRSEYYTKTFTNTGPIPPKVEQETTYTAVVEVANTSNAVSNGIVTMQLPNYVKYDGTFSPSSEDFSYDPVTRMLAWRIGTVGEKTGYAGNAPRRIAFQVSIIPSVSQAASSPSLVTNIRMSGTDTYTGKPIDEQGQIISTAIDDSKEFYDAQVSR